MTGMTLFLQLKVSAEHGLLGSGTNDFLIRVYNQLLLFNLLYAEIHHFNPLDSI